MPRKRTPKQSTDQATPAGNSILVLHGPNLNLLGSREPKHYGHQTLSEIDAALIERIHAARDQRVAYIIINPAAFTHTSVALRDALAAVAIPFIEVHLSNVHAREEFRKHSYFSDLAVGVISGLGAMGYLFALGYALNALEE